MDLPPITPMQTYSWTTLVQKEAKIMPVEQRQPPIMTMGLQPYVLTSILLIGPRTDGKH